MDDKEVVKNTNANTKPEIPTLSIKEMTAIVGKIALSCYGVSKLQAKHFYEFNKKKMSVSDSIEITMRPNKTYHIRVYISVAPHVKVTEVLAEVQKRIKYELEMAYKIKIRKIDIYAQSIE